MFIISQLVKSSVVKAEMRRGMRALFR